MTSYPSYDAEQNSSRHILLENSDDHGFLSDMAANESREEDTAESLAKRLIAFDKSGTAAKYPFEQVKDLCREILDAGW